MQEFLFASGAVPNAVWHFGLVWLSLAGPGCAFKTYLQAIVSNSDEYLIKTWFKFYFNYSGRENTSVRHYVAISVLREVFGSFVMAWLT